MIELSIRELQHAALDGAARYLDAVARGIHRLDKRAACAPWLQWGVHIEGAAGEIALAKFVGAHWAGMHGQGAPDVGASLQVRTVDVATKRLTVYDDADERDAYVLVDGCAPHYVLVGWLYAHEAKRDDWRERLRPDSCPAYFVPRDALRPIEDLVLKA
jgi:hypothetical protein